MELWCKELDNVWAEHLTVAYALRQLEDPASAVEMRPMPMIAKLNQQEAMHLASIRSREAQLRSRDLPPTLALALHPPPSPLSLTLTLTLILTLTPSPPHPLTGRAPTSP